MSVQTIDAKMLQKMFLAGAKGCQVDAQMDSGKDERWESRPRTIHGPVNLPIAVA